MRSPRKTEVSLPELAMIAGTRALAGVGIGLLVSERMNYTQRRAVGRTLLAIGIVSTIPLAFEVLAGRVTRGDERSRIRDAA